jgi:hypothetical protein
MTRNSLRAGAVAAGTALTLLLMTAPSFAAAPAADVQLAGLTVAESLGLYVGCPLALFVIISGLVLALTKPDKKI